jgi:hypothetical protein
MLKNILNRILHKAAFVLPGGYSLRPWLHRLRGAHIGKDVWISQYVYLDELHPEGVYNVELEPQPALPESAAREIFTAAVRELPAGPRQGRQGEDFAMAHVMKRRRGKARGRVVRAWVKEVLA